jgi:hypothetical protein
LDCLASIPEPFGEESALDAHDLIRARKAAAKLSAELGEPLEPRWFLETKWLQQLQLTHRVRGLCAQLAPALPRSSKPFLFLRRGLPGGEDQLPDLPTPCGARP